VDVSPFRQLNWLVVGFQPNGRHIFGKKWEIFHQNDQNVEWTWVKTDNNLA